MKILAALIVGLILIFSTLSLVTSNSTSVAQIAYGDTTSGVLNDDVFEWAYEFEGKVGDVIHIDLRISSSQNNLSTDLYIIRPDGSATYDTNLQTHEHNTSILQLHRDGTYMVVVERSGGRRYDGAGTFELSLDLVDPNKLASSWQGMLTEVDFQAAHLFYAEKNGTYRVSIDQPSRYNPALKILTLRPGQDWLEIVAHLDIGMMGRASFDIQLRARRYYVMLPYRPYNRSSSLTGNSRPMPYDISITPVDEPPQWWSPSQTPSS